MTMTHQLIELGDKSTLSLDLGTEHGFWRYEASPVGLQGPALEEALQSAVEEPMGYPRLADVIFPDDRVVVAVQGMLPEFATVASHMVTYLMEAGTQAKNLSVLVPESLYGHRLETLGSLRERLRVEVLEHQPRDRSRLSYLAADREARPVYIHRSLVDADFVITLDVAQAPSPIHFGGLPTGLYPTFSDEPTLERFRRGISSPRGAQPTTAQREADEANWLLGARFLVRLVPGADGVARVLAGDCDLVAKSAQSAYHECWWRPCHQSADVVIAILSGDAGQQTWENAAHGYAAATRVASDKAAIVISSNIASLPRSQPRKSGQGWPFESVLPLPLGRTDRGPFRHFLMSRLPDDAVEELGFTPIASVSDLRNLCRKGRNCAVLEHAQFQWPSAE